MLELPDPARTDADGTRTIDIVIRLVALGLLGAWCFSLLKPFVPVIVWGGILAVALHPIFRLLQRLFGGHPVPAAVLLTVVGLAIILGPVSLLLANFATSARWIAAGLADGTLTLPPPPDSIDVPLVGESIKELWDEAATDIYPVLERLRPQLVEYGTTLLGLAATVGLTLLEFLVAMVIAGALLTKGPTIQPALRLFVDRLTPHRGKAFVDLAGATVRNVARGVVGISMLQGVLLGLGFLGAGIPFAGLWTVIAIVLGIIQIGPGIVVLGTLIYAWTSLDTQTAVLFTVWIVPVALLDNVLRPIVMARGLPVPMIVIFIGVIGGTLVHGLVGLFVGPVVLAFGYELLRGWVVTGDASERIPSA